jgi:hypothetical protein
MGILSWSGAYVLVAAATIGLYFWDFKWPEKHPSFGVVLQDPGLGLQYLAAWLGSPFSQFVQSQMFPAVVIGVAILALAFYLSLSLLRIWKQTGENSILTACFPWIILLGYGAVSGVLTTAGRAGFGLKSALESRYTSQSLWVAIGLVGILYTLWSHEKETRGGRGNLRFGLIVGVTSILAVSSWFSGFEKMQFSGRSDQQELFTLQLLSVAPSNPMLIWLHPDPDHVGKRAKLLIEAGILDVEQVGDWIKKFPDASRRQKSKAGWFKVTRIDDEIIHVAGRAMLPNQGVPANYVVLGRRDEDENVDLTSGFAMDVESPEIVSTFDKPGSTFAAKFYWPLSKEPRFVMAAVDVKNQRLYRLSER